MAKSQVYDGAPENILGFVIACRSYLRMRMRGVVVEEQIQLILLYIQGSSADIWKENMLEDLKVEVLEYETVGEFLADLRKKFGREEEKTVKVAELRRLEQDRKNLCKSSGEQQDKVDIKGDF